MKKQDLLVALEQVKPGLANKETIEQTTSFAFVDGYVVTYNDEISVRHPVDIPFNGVVSAAELYGLLNKIKQEDIDLFVENNELHVTAGKSRAGITLIAEVKLPIEEIGSIGTWSPLPEKFIPAVKMAMFSCGKNVSKPILSCVHVHTDGYAEGTDNYKITHYDLGEKMPVGTFLIPSSTVQEIVRMNPVEIAEGSNWVHFRTKEQTVISCRTMDDKFPDASGVLKTTGTEMSFPSNISEILDRASVFAKRDNALNENITISMEGKKITIRSESVGGWFEEDAHVRYDGDPIKFSITPGLLCEILKDTQSFQYTSRFLRFAGEGWVYIASLRA